jgi:hypothetical protein
LAQSLVMMQPNFLLQNAALPAKQHASAHAVALLAHHLQVQQQYKESPP